MKKGYLDTIYDESKRPLTLYPSKLAQELKRRYHLVPGKSLLDLGCGRGEMSASFRDLGLRVTSCDRESTINRYYPDIDFKQASIGSDELPFDDNQFDVVFSKSVIEHLDNPLDAWHEIYRILRPGGLVITLCPSWEFNYRWFYEDFTHISPFQRESLEDIHCMSGFVNIEVAFFKQLPILWGKYTYFFSGLSTITRLIAPDSSRRLSKWIRFSKEIMLISSAAKQ